MFQSREDAAEQLAGRLAGYRGAMPLVLAVPRGAVPMGAIVARRLDGELDIALVHKLGAPGNPEFAVGAVDEHGHALFTAAADRVPQAYLDAEIGRQVAALAARRHRYGHAPADPADRIVIVVDDGIATGATLLTALRLVANRRPRRLIAAIPVAPRETLAEVTAVADEVICLETPEWFTSVGQHYQDFRQVDDDEVEALLAARPHGPEGA
ncbi:MAG: phosphoribosyltransferase [Gammaproteobacteria bacterium]|nr:MAG: phosphoribosyltransferase [Gammaproteobacteria bacterium]